MRIEGSGSRVLFPALRITNDCRHGDQRTRTRCRSGRPFTENDFAGNGHFCAEAAPDGQINRYIVLPYIKPIIRISVIFAVTGSLKSFDLIYVLTNGGPLHSTEVPSTLMISMLFLRNRFGMGSAIAVMLILLCFGFALLISAVFREEK